MKMIVCVHKNDCFRTRKPKNIEKYTPVWKETATFSVQNKVGLPSRNGQFHEEELYL
ncbi:hypothetical protein Bache_1330 [Bacteroides helcogenes P 36-108]|uniref:Uncharacterized protein n=1 Tax=Bacteroides helcogenes (strain ATCC 35417 / DSM 20613 / JCM 6297 / CCUG 15421 / P 36-108) TaxID=693979 RepID=E6SU35_BACT6|nr:hypothetical protein Bache_1330 [Bacteroides helcogenes P 36-108]